MSVPNSRGPRRREWVVTGGSLGIQKQFGDSRHPFPDHTAMRVAVGLAMAPLQAGIKRRETAVPVGERPRVDVDSLIERDVQPNPTVVKLSQSSQPDDCTSSRL